MRKYAVIHNGTLESEDYVYDVVPYADRDRPSDILNRYINKRWDEVKDDPRAWEDTGKEKYLDFERAHLELHAKGAYIINERTKKLIDKIFEYDTKYGEDPMRNSYGRLKLLAKESAIKSIKFNG